MKSPEYDPTTDGNVFEWILVAAWARRAIQSAGQRPAARAPDDRQAAHDAAIEAEERARFQSLRDRARRDATERVAKRNLP